MIRPLADARPTNGPTATVRHAKHQYRQATRFTTARLPCLNRQAVCLYSAGMAYSGQDFFDYQQFGSDAAFAKNIKVLAANFTGQTFALTFTSAKEERFTTIPINLDGKDTNAAVTAAYIEDALEGLPNGVIDSVSVDVEEDSDGTGILGESIDNYPCDMLIVVTFDGTEVRRVCEGVCCEGVCLCVRVCKR